MFEPYISRNVFNFLVCRVYFYPLSLALFEIVFKLNMTPENNFKTDTISVKTAQISFGTHVRLLPLIQFH
jgi:hypothetical protein